MPLAQDGEGCRPGRGARKARRGGTASGWLCVQGEARAPGVQAFLDSVLAWFVRKDPLWGWNGGRLPQSQSEMARRRGRGWGTALSARPPGKSGAMAEGGMGVEGVDAEG